jgi:hypothetical protein
MATPEPYRVGDESRVVKYVTTPEPSPTRWWAQCHRHVAMPKLSGTESGSGATGAHGGTGVLPYQVRSLAPQG